MSSTVTTSTVSTVVSTLFYGSLGLIVVLTLLFLLIKKEVLVTSSHPLAARLRKVVNVALVPLLVAFVFIALVNIAQVLA
jgi:hypothetical protein